LSHSLKFGLVPFLARKMRARCWCEAFKIYSFLWRELCGEEQHWALLNCRHLSNIRPSKEVAREVLFLSQQHG